MISDEWPSGERKHDLALIIHHLSLFPPFRSAGSVIKHDADLGKLVPHLIGGGKVLAFASARADLDQEGHDAVDYVVARLG